MTLEQFFGRIGMDEEARALVADVDRSYDHESLRPLWEKLYSPATWDEGVRELQQALAPDEDGMKMLTCMAHCALRTYDEYVRRGIPDKVFDETMQFLARFVAADKKAEGKCMFRWGWWFPRQLALREFRFGSFEYECSQNEERGKFISLHIPAGVRLDAEAAFASYAEARAFFAERFPDCCAGGVYCESWLMTPALRDLLPATSNILRFQSDFTVLRTDDESPAALDWIYGKRLPYEQLPEDTSLQRAAKAYLLAGKKIGWTLAKLKDEHWQ